MKINHLVTLSALACASQLVSAQPAETAPKSYILGSLGNARLNSPANTGGGVDLSGSGRRDTFKIGAGYQFDSTWGAEVNYVNLSQVTLTTATSPVAYSGQLTTLVGTASHLLGDFVSVGVRLGAAITDMKAEVPANGYSSTSRQNSLVWGWGVQYQLNKSAGFMLDYDDFGNVGRFSGGDKIRLRVISAGLKWKF